MGTARRAPTSDSSAPKSVAPQNDRTAEKKTVPNTPDGVVDSSLFLVNGKINQPSTINNQPQPKAVSMDCPFFISEGILQNLRQMQRVVYGKAVGNVVKDMEGELDVPEGSGTVIENKVIGPDNQAELPDVNITEPRNTTTSHVSDFTGVRRPSKREQRSVLTIALFSSLFVHGLLGVIFGNIPLFKQKPQEQPHYSIKVNLVEEGKNHDSAGGSPYLFVSPQEAEVGVGAVSERPSLSSKSSEVGQIKVVNGDIGILALTTTKEGVSAKEQPLHRVGNSNIYLKTFYSQSEQNVLR